LSRGARQPQEGDSDYPLSIEGVVPLSRYADAGLHDPIYSLIYKPIGFT